MNTIREVFAKQIDRPIEEVIKVEQADEQAVQVELEEYVLTDFLCDQYARVYDEIASGPANPREGIGIWVSGFFGSGKSLFAKILGYTVAARQVGPKTAAELFKVKLSHQPVADLLDSITTRIPFHAIIFDVSMDRGVRLANERLTEIVYKALLRELGYAEDFDLAAMEITLEGDGKLEVFQERFNQDTLFKVRADFVEPKARWLDARIRELKTRAQNSDTRERRAAEKEASQLADLFDDVQEFAQRLHRIVQRGYTPHIDDGVLLNAAPLWELLPSWPDARKAWQGLEAGEFDWAQQAMEFWPDRVKEKCRTNKSFAIAHGLA